MAETVTEFISVQYNHLINFSFTSGRMFHFMPRFQLLEPMLTGCMGLMDGPTSLRIALGFNAMARLNALYATFLVPALTQCGRQHCYPTTIEWQQRWAIYVHICRKSSLGMLPGIILRSYFPLFPCFFFSRNHPELPRVCRHANTPNMLSSALWSQRRRHHLKNANGPCGRTVDEQFRRCKSRRLRAGMGDSTPGLKVQSAQNPPTSTQCSMRNNMQNGKHKPDGQVVGRFWRTLSRFPHLLARHYPDCQPPSRLRFQRNQRRLRSQSEQTAEGLLHDHDSACGKRY